MACFIVPGTEAILLSVAKLIVNGVTKKTVADSREKALKLEAFNKSTGILQKMLYGGSFLLAIEHIYHGEVVFYPPFLTAMQSPDDTAEMLHEMSTVGLSMAVLVTSVWAIGLLASKILKKGEGRFAGGIV